MATAFLWFGVPQLALAQVLLKPAPGLGFGHFWSGGGVYLQAKDQVRSFLRHFC